MNILIGISWPFANGDLHIGHVASSLPGDVIARYHRLKGNHWIVNIFLDNFYKDNCKRYCTGV